MKILKNESVFMEGGKYAKIYSYGGGYFYVRMSKVPLCRTVLHTETWMQVS
jgi:hypothetical protein